MTKTNMLLRLLPVALLLGAVSLVSACSSPQTRTTTTTEETTSQAPIVVQPATTTTTTTKVRQYP
jgi:uncharacterized lipoprotein YajG